MSNDDDDRPIYDLTHISRCATCGQVIHYVAGKWRHKLDGLTYSPVGGDHLAAPRPVPWG